MALRDEGRLALDDRLDDLPARHPARRGDHPADAGARLGPAARAGGPHLGEPRGPRPERLLRRARGRRAGAAAALRLPLLQPRLRACSARSSSGVREAQLGGDRHASAILDPLEMRAHRAGPRRGRPRPGLPGRTRTPAPSRVEPRFDLRRHLRRSAGSGAPSPTWAATPPSSPDPVAEVLSPDTVEEMCRPLIMTDVDGWGRAYGLGFDLQRVAASGSWPGTAARCPASSPGCGSAASTGSAPWSSATARPAPRRVALATRPGRGRARRRAGAGAGRGRPRSRSPDLAELLGSWWSEGEELVFGARRPAVGAARPATAALGETRFEREGADRYRAVQGRERGELLEVVRADDGSVRQIYFATYAVTRTPHAFADLSARPTQRTGRRRPDTVGPPRAPEGASPMVDRGRLAELLQRERAALRPAKPPAPARRTRPRSTCSGGSR